MVLSLWKTPSASPALLRSLLRHASSLAPQNKANEYLESIVVESCADGKFCLTSRGRTLKSPSPSLQPLIVPSSTVGELLLAEWRGCLGNPRERPSLLASIVYRALDLQKEAALACELVEELVSFCHTDSICYFDPNPEILALQRAAWLPIISSIKKQYGLDSLHTTEAFAPMRQPRAVTDAARHTLSSLSPFQLAGFEQLTREFKSLLLPLALHGGLATVATATSAALLESEIQSQKWGSIDEFHALKRSQMRRNASLGYLLLKTPNRK